MNDRNPSGVITIKDQTIEWDQLIGIASLAVQIRADVMVFRCEVRDWQGTEALDALVGDRAGFTFQHCYLHGPESMNGGDDGDE